MPKVHHVPQRQCVACRQVRPKRELIRVVRTPGGDVRVDRTGKISGRGAYVCPSGDCADRALRERQLEHALEVTIPETVAEEIRALAQRGVQVSGKA
jgi:predicted RNA-binding protein YlxR (DUF448 family)